MFSNIIKHYTLNFRMHYNHQSLCPLMKGRKRTAWFLLSFFIAIQTNKANCAVFSIFHELLLCVSHFYLPLMKATLFAARYTGY